MFHFRLHLYHSFQFIILIFEPLKFHNYWDHILNFQNLYFTYLTNSFDHQGMKLNYFVNYVALKWSGFN